MNEWNYADENERTRLKVDEGCSALCDELPYNNMEVVNPSESERGQTAYNERSSSSPSAEEENLSISSRVNQVQKLLSFDRRNDSKMKLKTRTTGSFCFFVISNNKKTE